MLRIWDMILSAANLLLSAASELPGFGGWGVCESHELEEAMITGLRIPGLGEERNLASSPPTLQTQIFLSIKGWGGGRQKESWIFKFFFPPWAIGTFLQGKAGGRSPLCEDSLGAAAVLEVETGSLFLTLTSQSKENPRISLGSDSKPINTTQPFCP